MYTEKQGLLTNVVGNLSHKGIARRAFPASGGKDEVGGGGGGGVLGIKNVNKGE